MKILYAVHGVNQAECRIIAKAIFVYSAQVVRVPPLKAAMINIKSTFHAFIHVDNAQYVSVRGHYYLYQMGWRRHTFRCTLFQSSKHYYTSIQIFKGKQLVKR